MFQLSGLLLPHSPFLVKTILETFWKTFAQKNLKRKFFLIQMLQSRGKRENKVLDRNARN